MNLLEQAKEAVRLSRDFVPSDGRHYKPDELDELNRRCKEAFLACQRANTTIAEMRRQLWVEEREAYRKQLAALSGAQVQRIADEFKAAALAQVEGRGK